MLKPLPCPDCDRGRVVDYLKHDRGQSSGAPENCPECGGSGVASCFWRFAGCTRTATTEMESMPACENCCQVAEADAALDDLPAPAPEDPATDALVMLVCGGAS